MLDNENDIVDNHSDSEYSLDYIDLNMLSKDGLKSHLQKWKCASS